MPKQIKFLTNLKFWVLVIAIFLSIAFIFASLLNKTKLNHSDEYASGQIIVTFKEGITYKQASQLFQKIGATIIENDYWKSKNETPNETAVISGIGFFLIRVSPGTEDKIIQELQDVDIVKGASKNAVGWAYTK